MFPLYDNNPTRHPPVLTYALVIINVLVFFWMSRMPEWQQEVRAYRHGFVPARIAQLRQDKPIVVPIDIATHDPFWGDRVERRALELPPSSRQVAWSMVTCMFLHGGWMHLLSNMWFLWLFGNNVEDRLGKFFFLLLYFVGGFLATGLHWLTASSSMVPVIGASGAIAAVLGAYAVTWPWARVSCLVFLVVFVTIIDVPAMIVLGMWFVLQVMEGQRSLNMAASGGVAWWAHVGGFLAGMVLMPLLGTLVVVPEGPDDDESADAIVI